MFPSQEYRQRFFGVLKSLIGRVGETKKRTHYSKTKAHKIWTDCKIFLKIQNIFINNTKSYIIEVSLMILIMLILMLFFFFGRLL